MTTTFEVEADDCAADEEIQIDYKDASGSKQKILQAGEKFKGEFYDGITCSVVKRKKSEVTAQVGGHGQTPPDDDEGPDKN